jgi:hypothetical protein
MNHQQELRAETAKFITRRWFFQQCGVGLGSIALSSLLSRGASAAVRPVATHPLAPRPAHFPGQARRVIYLFMGGAPSQLDLSTTNPPAK